MRLQLQLQGSILLCQAMKMPNLFSQIAGQFFFSIEVNLPNDFLPNFSSWLHRQGVLNKDCTVWLDVVRPANTHIPPSFLRNAPVQMHSVPTYKSTFANVKNKQILTLFVIENKDQRKCLANSLWATVNLSIMCDLAFSTVGQSVGLP
jgi:hypothetical protein